MYATQTVSPNGVGFVDAATRPGVLPRMLSEILETRVMVKGAMKSLSPSDRVRLCSCVNSVLEMKVKEVA